MTKEVTRCFLLTHYYSEYLALSNSPLTPSPPCLPPFLPSFPNPIFSPCLAPPSPLDSSKVNQSSASDLSGIPGAEGRARRGVGWRGYRAGNGMDGMGMRKREREGDGWGND
ncbi:hypothetical protein E2C01_064947 [Portunus trituberculatus]|uniref:Uncharacterized protein n=1 Tax=Portunus trituberculatus TaxID=210409 RepID=A0A5B7HKK1_PORTR|nr:hypothetical protein [Portunus trituberculatus]